MGVFHHPLVLMVPSLTCQPLSRCTSPKEFVAPTNVTLIHTSA